MPALAASPAFHPRILCSAGGLTAEHGGRKWGFDAATSDEKEVLGDAAVQAVFVLTRHNLHAGQAVAALSAGKHVFVEKPHGIDPRSVKLMQQACDLAKEKKLCMVSGLQSRFHTGYIETVKRIQDGAIGDIVSRGELPAGPLRGDRAQAGI